MSRSLGAVTVVTLALAGCGGPLAVPVGEDETARTVEVAPGEELEVAVSTNASIGWTWSITTEPDPAVAAFVSRDYEADDPGSIGSGGTDLFRFRAEGPGETTIVLGRDFRGEGIDREVTITVLVAEDG